MWLPVVVPQRGRPTSSVFKHPADVVACKDLDKSEQAAILKHRELDARLLQVATEEGMTEGERSRFAAVRKAQREAPPARPRGGRRAYEVGTVANFSPPRGARVTGGRADDPSVAVWRRHLPQLR